MISVFNCSPVVRGVCETVILMLSMSNWIAVMYAFLDKKKWVLLLNVLTFLMQFGVLNVFMSVTEEKLHSKGSVFFYPMAKLPLGLFFGISLLGFGFGIISIFAFTDRKRRRLTDEGIPKEKLLLHERALQLQADMVRLGEMNEQMRIYGEEMQEQIKEKEILEAKMNIHAGMNRLLLSSQYAIECNASTEIENAVALWQRDALLLCREADNKPVSELLLDIKSLAKSLGLQLECIGLAWITDEKTLLMLYKTACECMTNAAKHAAADRFMISSDGASIIFSNNGKMPPSPAIEMHGGLLAIKKIAEETGYTVHFSLSDTFSLILRKE